jgi:hypothetical protein
MAGIGADDAIELAAELQGAAEQPTMQLQVVRGLVHEIDAVGVPVGTEQCGTQAEHHADGQLCGLLAGHWRFGDHLFANDHHLAGLFDEDRQRIVHQMSVMQHDLQGIAQRALMSEQQADHAEIRELTRLGHAQAEGLAATAGGRLFQQAHGGVDGNAVFRGL